MWRWKWGVVSAGEGGGEFHVGGVKQPLVALQWHGRPNMKLT